ISRKQSRGRCWPLECSSRGRLICDLDRGLKFGAAIVTGPDVVDPAREVEARLLGHQQTTAAMRAIRALGLHTTFRRMDRLRPSEGRGRDHRFSPRILTEPLRYLACPDGAAATAA